MQRFLNATVYKEKIKDEVEKPKSLPIFNGAWYYKILSSYDKWLGFEALLTLPEFTEDKTRFQVIDGFKRYNDTPSCYVGGVSDFENDIGFGWFRGLVNNKMSDEKITFRPFWRYIYLENGIEKNIYTGTKIEEDEYYFFPGDKVKIDLFCVKENYLVFRLELIEKTKIKKYQDIRLKLTKDVKILLVEDIPASGNGIKNASYKRVNAIDQYGNEGKPVQDTNAYVKSCIWEDMYLFREVEGKIVKVPFTEDRYLKIYAPFGEAFKITKYADQEVISIFPHYTS